MTRCAIYVRVACVEQGSGEKAFAAQEAAGAKFCRRKGWKYEVFREAGLPGAMLRKLVELVKAGKFDYVFVKTCDRLSRKIFQFVAIAEEIEQSGAEIVTSAGRLRPISAIQAHIADLTPVFRRYRFSRMAEKRWASARGRNLR